MAIPITKKAKGSPFKKDGEKSWLNKAGHTTLDVLGLVPGFGEIADGANAAWYASEGDYKNAALSTAAMIPFAGWGATGAKLGMKGYKTLSKGAKGMDKFTKKTMNIGFTKNPMTMPRNIRATESTFELYENREDLSNEMKQKLINSTAKNDKKDTEIKLNGTGRTKQGSSDWGRAVINNDSGTSLTELVKQRNSAKKGSEEYAIAQNAINKAYKVKKRY